MSFAPSLSLFIGLGVMVGVLSTVLAIAIDRIDARVAQRSCEKAIAARRARKERDAQRAWKTHRDALRHIAMGIAAAKAVD
ncbi:hypothetical protein QYH69_06645 [Paraburkholderia sp. SARCC-3016]|uniref:hypothetical protein n=1 Tax=Paraburkholderia sp. SARCC-3016 TaxID=3058611 RepID=UPI00280774F9|nr:hypothetical protein [Paraburkholderia sp. SARCC-3016]MDQ7976921.1 hypothetical protein [Paraburkholderia sp. SARCC-3016]